VARKWAYSESLRIASAFCIRIPLDCVALLDHQKTHRQECLCYEEKQKMKRCLAFSALVGSRDAWRPCSRRAVPGSAFCGRHTEVMAGVMLGLCVNGFLDGGPDAPKVTRPQNSDTAAAGNACAHESTGGRQAKRAAQDRALR